MPSRLLAECLEQFEEYGFEPEFQSYFLSKKSRLLGNEEVACGLVVLCAQEDSNASQLLGLLLDEARMGLENDNEYATGFLAAVEETIQAGLSAGALQQEDLIKFAGLYRRVGLPVPHSLTLKPTNMPPPANMENFDLSENLEQLARDVLADGGTTYDLFNAIDTMTAALPEEIQASLLNHLAMMPSPVFERCALFLMLSGSEIVQQAIIAGLMEKLDAAGLGGETLKLLPMIRGWFAAGSVQAGLDALIQKARKKSPPAPTSTPSAKIQKIIASITDGVGAQSVAVTLKQGRKLSLAMMLIKAGHGVKDSFLLSPESNADAKHLIAQLRTESGADDIADDTLRVLLEGALADGLENGHLPAPGFLDVVEACNLYDLRPQKLGLEALLNLVDPNRKIQAASTQSLGRWINDEEALELLEQLSDSWFEDTAETRQIIASGKTAHDIETKIWKFLESRRELWARRFLQTAAMLRDNNRLREWKTLAASAHGLITGRPLKRIPLMEDIMYTTVEAAEMRMWQSVSL